jgi:uncharacterized protein (DUF58 family)
VQPQIRYAIPRLAGRLDPMIEAPEGTPEGWAPTKALGRAALLVALFVIAAMVFGRIDLVVLAVPFALGSALALSRRPERAPEVRITVAESFLGEGGEVHATLSAYNADVTAYDLVVLRTYIDPWLRFRYGDRPFVTPAPRDGIADVPLVGEALRWGRYALGPAAVQAVACDGLLVSPPRYTVHQNLKVYPITEPFRAAEAMPRAAGMVGGHRSRRPGHGGELAGVRVFGPGDRLRRIDWRVSLRSEQLHVAATLSDRDAEVALLLDVLTEAGRSGGLKGSASVLDTTVRAAAGIAEHYLLRGDRVSLLEYGFQVRRLRAASGRRQYLTTLEWLLDVSPSNSGYEPSPIMFGPHMLSANALVVVLTPLIDPRSAGLVARLARAGRFVIAVDTLPRKLSVPVRGEWAEIGTRLWLMERANTIGQLREHGVPVVAWAGTGSLDEVLRDVTRLAAAPKLVYR